MKKIKFIRQDSNRHSKIGKRRKKLQVWRSSKGMHSKMRKRRKGYPSSPAVGYKSAKEDFGKILGMTPVLIHNEKELSKIGKNSAAIIARRVGSRKKIALIKKAEEMKIKILNVRQEAKI